MVVQIKSGKRENGTSFWDNLYRKRSRPSGSLISYKVVSKTFCRSQLPRNSFNMSFANSDLDNTLPDLCGNWLLKTDVKNALCEIKSEGLLDHSLAPLPSMHGGRVGFRVQGLGVGGSGAGFGV